MKSFLKKKNMIDLNQKLSENFTLNEFIDSKVAKKKKIDNTPTLLVISHLKELCLRLLQPFRDYYGKPIIVTSGYRCPALNDAVNGVKTSSHLYGNGADLLPADGDFEAFLLAWDNYLNEHPEQKYDEIIIEKSKKEKWLHTAYKSAVGKQRMKYLTLEV